MPTNSLAEADAPPRIEDWERIVRVSRADKRNSASRIMRGARWAGLDQETMEGDDEIVGRIGVTRRVPSRGECHDRDVEVGGNGIEPHSLVGDRLVRNRFRSNRGRIGDSRAFLARQSPGGGRGWLWMNERSDLLIVLATIALRPWVWGRWLCGHELIVRIAEQPKCSVGAAACGDRKPHPQS
jgi:hypothetical protein